jgi:CspA family cold shock protein
MSDNGNADTKRVRGKVKWFNETRFYGFCTLDEGGEDIFLHGSALSEDEEWEIREGDSVEFEIAPGKDGRVKARNVTILTKYTPPSDPAHAKHIADIKETLAPRTTPRSFRS